MWLPHSTAWTKYGSVGERGQNPVHDGRKGISGAENTVAWVTAFTVKEWGRGEHQLITQAKQKTLKVWDIFFFVGESGCQNPKIIMSTFRKQQRLLFCHLLLPPVLS